MRLIPILLVMTERTNRFKPVGRAIPDITRKTAFVKKTALPIIARDIRYHLALPMPTALPAQLPQPTAPPRVLNISLILVKTDIIKAEILASKIVLTHVQVIVLIHALKDQIALYVLLKMQLA